MFAHHGIGIGFPPWSPSTAPPSALSVEGVLPRSYHFYHLRLDIVIARHGIGTGLTTHTPATAPANSHFHVADRRCSSLLPPLSPPSSPYDFSPGHRHRLVTLSVATAHSPMLTGEISFPLRNVQLFYLCFGLFFFCLFITRVRPMEIMTRLCTVRSLSAVRAVAAHCKHPFALRPGLSHEDDRTRTKEMTQGKGGLLPTYEMTKEKRSSAALTPFLRTP